MLLLAEMVLAFPLPLQSLPSLLLVAEAIGPRRCPEPELHGDAGSVCVVNSSIAFLISEMADGGGWISRFPSLLVCIWRSVCAEPHLRVAVGEDKGVEEWGPVRGPSVGVSSWVLSRESSREGSRESMVSGVLPSVALKGSGTTNRERSLENPRCLAKLQRPCEHVPLLIPPQ